MPCSRDRESVIRLDRRSIRDVRRSVNGVPTALSDSVSRVGISRPVDGSVVIQLSEIEDRRSAPV
jgi:hypothetical protein